MTRLCVPIFVESHQQVLRDAALAAEAGADVVEYRLDGSKADGSYFADRSILPKILTDRSHSEGGRSESPDQCRADALITLSHLAEFIDFELASLKHVTFQKQDLSAAKLILSSHDFKGRPDRLYNIITELDNSISDINKIVWTARTIRDNIEAFEILKQKQKPTIALCMGEAGLISRVLAKKFGAFLTFASLRDESATAPGQVTIADMKGLYRWDALKASTKVYGVVGSPVAHSMSPAIHNSGFDAVNHDGVYLPLLVKSGYESFKAFMESFLAFAPLDLAGLSITIPHKENALRYLKERGAQIEALAERIGTVNTITIDRSFTQSSVLSPQSSLRGANTDYAAILDTITSTLNITREDLADKRVAVLGAGGTGRTAVAALAEYGATVVVYNRTKERADALATEFNGRRGKVVSARLEKLCDSCCHIYVNTTSVGMHPKVDASPLGDAPPKFTPDTLVFDTIYNPLETKLLRDAKAGGAKTVGGIEMFVRQAAGQFETWTNKPAPLDLFRKVIEEKLKPRMKADERR